MPVAGQRFNPVHRILLVGVLTAAVGMIALRLWWTRPSAPPLSITQIQGFLPQGSLLHSLARLEMDGRPPQEVAVVGVIPQYPGASSSTYFAFVFGFDRWQRRFRALYAEPLSGPVPQPADAVRLLGPREAALFSALHDDGTLSYRIVGMARGVRDLYTGRVQGRLLVADSLLVEDGPRQRALAWDGRVFRERSLAAAIPLPPPRTTWRYRVQNGMILARTPVVYLRPRQTLRLARVGGGPIPIVLPDPRLDLTGDNVFRARYPGTYAISILIPFDSPEQTYRLTLIVE